RQLVPVFLLRLTADFDRGLDRLVDIVGVEQQGVARQRLGDGPERLLLGRKALDQRVRDCAAGRDAEGTGSGQEGGAGTTGDVAGAGRDVRLLRAPEAELGHALALRRLD